MKPSPALLVEDWTPGEPRLSPNANLLADLRRLKRENARLQSIERNARAVMCHVNAGLIDARGPLACMAVVELGASVGMPITRGRK